MTHRFLLAFLMVLLLPAFWKLQAQGDEGDARHERDRQKRSDYLAHCA